MATLKNDVDSGTQLTQGVELFEPTSARRMVHVSSQGGTSRDNLKNAITIFEDSHSRSSADNIPIHPDFEKYGDLPLATVTARPWGDGTTGIGVYRRSRASLPRFEAFDGEAHERWYRAGKQTIRLYPPHEFRYNWTVSGEDRGDDWSTTYLNATKEYRRNEIVVRTLLDEHPIPTILDRLPPPSRAFAGVTDNENLETASKTIRIGEPGNTSHLMMAVNDKPFIISGRVLPRGTLRLDGINVTPLSVRDKVKFEVEYTFLEDPRTWFKRITIWERATCSDLSQHDQAGTAPGSDNGCADGTSTTFIYKDILIDAPWQSTNGRIIIIPIYPIVDFEGLFPTHDQLDGYRSPASSGNRSSKRQIQPRPGQFGGSGLFFGRGG